MATYSFKCIIEQINPQKQDFEIVERKGLGHPDSLADGLAEAISNEYSRYCLDRLGFVLHHNLDKLYIGGGLWKSDYGVSEMKHPVLIRVNGRISSCFGDHKIDLEGIQREAIKSYLSRVMPRLKLDDNIIIDHNATQHTRRQNWFTPQIKEDLPELSTLVASDTAVSVAYAPLTPAEKLCLDIERFFWDLSEDGKIKRPKFEDIGQDIKVMAFRTKNRIELYVCIPVICTYISSKERHLKRIEELEESLKHYLKTLSDYSMFDIHLHLAKGYLLALGSCIECGEEGLVGRGNGLSGLISVMRPKSNEAYFGKNPMYHVGRVQMHLTRKLSRELFRLTGISNTVYALGVHSSDLIPPKQVRICSDEPISQEILDKAASTVFEKENYLKEIINSTLVDNFNDKYY